MIGEDSLESLAFDEKARVSMVVGVNWGDEGKGRVVDYLAAEYDVVVRFQGGANAGHTVVNDMGTFKLNLLPSGVFRPDVLNVLGPGMVIDFKRLGEELDDLERRGVAEPRIVISDRATLTLPYHALEDEAEERRLQGVGCEPYGSTLRGIAPAYSDRYRKKALQAGALKEPDYLRRMVTETCEWKAVMLSGYGDGLVGDGANIEESLAGYADRFGARIVDVAALMGKCAAAGKRILFEGQLGALRDINYGIYPFTSSSPCLASYAFIGGGLLEFRRAAAVVGVIKAFSSCVGAGPFVTEMSESEAAELREVGNEYGAATMRPRRIGHFDGVASRYGVRLQDADYLVLTKMDTLSGREELRVCTAYELPDGRVTDEFVARSALEGAKPVYERMCGWEEELRDVRRLSGLPLAAQRYISRIEEIVECRVRYVSVGPRREEIIEREA